MPAPKDDHTDRQGLREELIKIIDTYGYDELPTAEHVADAMLKVIDAYTEQRVREALEWVLTIGFNEELSVHGVFVARQIKDRIAQLKASTNQSEGEL